jgi:glycogen operon protein
MSVSDWETPDFATLGMILETDDAKTGKQISLAVLFNRAQSEQTFSLPADATWRRAEEEEGSEPQNQARVPARSVSFLVGN